MIKFIQSSRNILAYLIFKCKETSKIFSVKKTGKKLDAILPLLALVKNFNMATRAQNLHHIRPRPLTIFFHWLTVQTLFTFLFK
jgi:hypothetical protein